MLTDDFSPKIKDRDTQDLLIIVGAPDKWSEKAVQLALQELEKRKVPESQIELAKHHHRKRKKIKSIRKSYEGYSIADFICEPLPTIFEILFSWELKKEGYIKKHKQQQVLRIVIIFVILLLIILSQLNDE